MSSSFFLPLPALSAPKSPLEKGRASVLSWRGKTCLPRLRAGRNQKADNASPHKESSPPARGAQPKS